MSKNSPAMASIGRETSRASSKTSMSQSDKPSSRPFLLKKAYHGTRVGSRLTKVNSKSHDLTSADSVNLKSFSGVFPLPEPQCKIPTPPELTQEQESKYREVLEYFENMKDFPTNLKATNTKREPANDWEKLRLLSKESMLRYLRATRWDVAAAKKRLTETIAWRREYGVDDLDSDVMAEEASSGKETVLGFDNQSRPLHYMHPHRNDTKESPRQMQFAVWILERCIDLMPPGTEQLALLINFDHKSRNPTSIANARLMLYILQNHYVERLGIALCINVPWVFKMFWNAIQAFIDPVTKSKCKFDEAIKDEVPVSQLSSEFGGELDSKYKHDQYWPDLVKLSAERRKEMLRRFKEDCGSKIGASEWMIRGGNDPTSPFKKDSHMATLSEAGTESESSGIPSSDPQAGERARAAAVVASDGRVEDSATPRYEEPDTPLSEVPLSRFATPTTLNTTPLDRRFSSKSVNGETPGAAVGGGTLALETTEEKPTEKEQAAKEQDHHHNGAGAKFKDFDHKIQHSFEQAFHHRSSSPKGSVGSKRRSLTGVKSAGEQHEDELKSVEADRKDNVETGEDFSAKGKPTATEAAAVAGAVGVAGAAMGTTSGDKLQGVVNGSAKNSKFIHVLYFAAAKEAAGIGRQDIILPESPFPLAKLGTHLVQLVSKSGKGDSKAFQKVLEQSKWSVDEDMVNEEEIAKLTLQGGEDVAIIPPVSGG